MVKFLKSMEKKLYFFIFFFKMQKSDLYKSKAVPQDRKVSAYTFKSLFLSSSINFAALRRNIVIVFFCIEISWKIEENMTILFS